MKRICILFVLAITSLSANAQWKIKSNDLYCTTEVKKLNNNGTYSAMFIITNKDNKSLEFSLILKDSLNNIIPLNNIYYDELSISSRLTKKNVGVLKTSSHDEYILIHGTQDFSLGNFTKILTAQPCIATLATTDAEIYDIMLPSGNFGEAFNSFISKIRNEQVHEWVRDGQKLTLFTQGIMTDYFKRKTSINATISITKSPLGEYTIILSFLNKDGIKISLDEYLKSYKNNLVGVSKDNITFSAPIRNNDIILSTPARKVNQVISIFERGESFFISIIADKTGGAFTALIPANTDFNKKFKEFKALP